MEEMRTAKRLVNKRTKEWQDIPIQDIKKGMRFKLFEPDGTEVTFHGESCDYFVADTDSYMRSYDGVWTVRIVDPWLEK